MRIPFAAGHLSPRRNRILLVRGHGPRPIIGPWTLKGLVREDHGVAPTRLEASINASSRSSAAPESTS